MNKDSGANLSAPTADTSLDNLTCQGFSKDDASDNPLHQKSDYIMRNKMTFDVHQTNPQLVIQPTVIASSGFMTFVSWAIQTRMHNLTSRNLSP